MKIIKIIVASIVIISALAAAASAATVDISSTAAAPGMSKNVSIVARNVTNLGNFGLTLFFDQSVINVVSISNNPQLSGEGINEIHNDTGYASIGSGNFISKPSLSGDIILANVTIRAIGSPRTASFLNLSIGRLLDNSDVQISVTAITNGTFTIVPKGDVDGYPGISMADAMYIGKAVLGKSGFILDTTTMDVDGQAGVTLNDALYLAKYVIGVPGFETLQ